MNRLIALILFLCTCTFLAIGAPSGVPVPLKDEFSQTPEQLLAKAVQSIGGRKELNSLQSFQLHGIMRLPDDRPVVEIDLATKKGGKVLGVMTYIGVGQSQFGSDGVTAWEQRLNPNNDISWELISDTALTQKVQQMNWLQWFTSLPNKLAYMEVAGEEEFDGHDCWKVKISEEGQNEQIAFFSKQTYHPKGRRTIEQTSDGETVVDVFFNDWERVGDLLLFHTVVYNREGTEVTMKIDRIILDKAGDELFELPQPIKELRDAQ